MKSSAFLLLIAAFAAFAALFSAGFTYYSVALVKESVITGFASQANATVNLTVSTLLSLNFTNATILWGSGTFNAGSTRANLTTSGAGGTVSAVGGTWSITDTNGSAGFVLENLGNVNATVHIMSGKTASTFIGGTSPAYKYNVTNIESSSCLNNTGGTTTGGNGGLIDLGLFADANATNPGTPICGRFQFIDSADAIRIGIHLSVPYDSLNGTLTDAFTVLYCLAPGPCS